MIDLKTVRADTPGCEEVLHFNNAGAALMPAPVHDAVAGHLRDELMHGGYEAEASAADALSALYDELAAFLGCSPDEVAYVENATRAWDMAFYSIPFSTGDRVITHGSEYSSNYLALLQTAERLGIEIDLAPSAASGEVDVDGLEAMIQPTTRLIAVTHVPTQGGLINPAEEIGRVARKHGITYLLDACQSAGQISLDVARIGCHMLSGTGRKFLRGPRGTGFLYVSNDIVESLSPPFIDMRAADWTAPGEYRFAPGARRFENWESFVAGRIGLLAALRYARSVGMVDIEQRVRTLASSLRERLQSAPGASCHDLGSEQCGIVTFTLDDESPAATQQRLAAHGINVSVTDRYSAQIDFNQRGIDSLVRASVHYFNSEEEVERFVNTVLA